ncbi:MAG: hypothetical protein JXR23_06955 [Pontiellaceae bacterium]|nr:hypothetical protein [Pontiellaceae bacterium]
MKNSNHFSEQVLEQTLLAVRREKRRKYQRRSGLALCLLLLGLVVVLRPAPKEVAETSAQTVDANPNSELEDGIIFSTVGENEWMDHVTIFSTKDYTVEVEYIDTDTMNEMLAGIPHGVYQTADGKMHFWLPDSTAGL